MECGVTRWSRMRGVSGESDEGATSRGSVMYCAVLYCTVLYYTVMYCTVLYCAELYCPVLCYASVYHAMLYHAVCHHEGCAARDVTASTRYSISLTINYTSTLLHCNLLHPTAVKKSFQGYIIRHGPVKDGLGSPQECSSSRCGPAHPRTLSSLQ